MAEHGERAFDGLDRFHAIELGNLLFAEASPEVLLSQIISDPDVHAFLRPVVPLHQLAILE